MNIRKFFSNIKEEFRKHTFTTVLLLVILSGSFFVRTFRATDLMAFHYDQARDALKIWDFWHKGDIFLVGPVTGLSGIFLGPLYYFLIAPLYLVSSGNPAVPAVFLAFLVTCSIYIVYQVAKEIHSRETGLIAAFVSSFSYYLILAGRWVSNPTPIFLGSMIFFYSLYKLTMDSKKYWWIVAVTAVCASLQFESASGFFYLPILFFFYLWKRRTSRSSDSNVLPDKKVFVISTIIFVLSITPQIIFSMAHQNMLIQNFTSVFTEQKGFRLTFWDVIDKRLDYFWTVFSSKILPTRENVVYPFLFLSVLGLFGWKDPQKSKILKLFLIFLGVPVVGYILFQGNHGNIYDYYMTGYYLPMVLLFSLGLGVLWKKSIYGKIVVGLFLVWFIQVNFTLTRYFLIAGVDGPTHISLGNELQAVNWVYENAKGMKEFNADFYVPPVIPYTYDYLFLWQGNKRCGPSLCGLIKEPQKEIVYVLYEVDPPHPERLENWLIKYKDTSVILEEVKFGGITVQKRLRKD